MPHPSEHEANLAPEVTTGSGDPRHGDAPGLPHDADAPGTPDADPRAVGDSHPAHDTIDTDHPDQNPHLPHDADAPGTPDADPRVAGDSHPARGSIDTDHPGQDPSLPPGAGTDPNRGGSVPGARVRLRPPRHQVDRRSIGLWSVQAGLGAAAGLGALLVVGAILDVTPGWFVATSTLATGLALAYVVLMPRIRYRVHRWEVTADAVYTKAGWLTHEWRVAPLSRVQTVDARRGPLQQLFGLSSVRITTASAAGDVTIDGLDQDLAADLVETLTARTEAIPGDAT